MAHQHPQGHPMHFANAGNHQNFQYGVPQGSFAPPIFPPGLPHPSYPPQFMHAHPQYAPPMMANLYGQPQAYGGAVNPAHIAGQQALQARPPLQPIQPIQPQVAPEAQAAPPPKHRPNREVRPGVFALQIEVLDGEKREAFYADTAMPWVEFRDRVVRILGDPKDVKLAGKIAGDGGWGLLNGEDGLANMMQRVVRKASNARTKPVALEVKNTVTPPSSLKPKSKGKRNRNEDVPPAAQSDDEENAQYTAYKQLAEETRCEAHHGHCYITRHSGTDSHHRLSHQEMTLWAKKMSLNEATKFAPPHCLNFDRGATMKSGRRSAPTTSIPEVHVTIQNIAPEGSSVAAPAGQHVSSSSSSEISQHRISTPPSHETLHTSSSSTRPLENAFQAFAPPAIAGPSTPATPFRSGANPASIGWGVPIPALQGQNIFPTLSSVIALLASERPGPFWSQLEEFLWEAGVSSSEHILLADPTVLALVGNMGTQQATVLRNYAKRLILPVLGLQGTYQEEEKEEEDLSSGRRTRKRSFDLGDTLVRNLHKKRKIDHAQDTAPTPAPPSIDPVEVSDQNLPTYDFEVDFADSEEESDESDSDSEEEDELADDED